MFSMGCCPLVPIASDNLSSTRNDRTIHGRSGKDEKPRKLIPLFVVDKRKFALVLLQGADKANVRQRRRRLTSCTCGGAGGGSRCAGAASGSRCGSGRLTDYSHAAPAGHAELLLLSPPTSSGATIPSQREVCAWGSLATISGPRLVRSSHDIVQVTFLPDAFSIHGFTYPELRHNSIRQ
jgi:hypothetical protein